MFDILNGYWNIATVTGSVFSSGRNQYVPTSDTTYQAWLAAGGTPASLSDEPSLVAFFNQNVPWYVVDVQAGLIAYAQRKQTTIMGGGVSINVGSGVTVKASTDYGSLILLQGAFTIAQASPSTTFNWVQSDGTTVVLTSAQLTALFEGVTPFLQSTFTTLKGVVDAIKASTITTQAGVDSPPSPIPAWPTNS